MPAYAALLRAVNLGSTSRISSADLCRIATKCGFADVRTYIASGNLLFKTDETEVAVRDTLEQALAAHFGKPVGVFVRTHAELAAITAQSPFADRPGTASVVLFLHKPPAAAALQRLVAPDGEEAALGTREIYLHYPNGQGRSRLKLPALADGTARNFTTVAKLRDLTA
jgi:uncharacterized protein (DUF1697 family)